MDIEHRPRQTAPTESPASGLESPGARFDRIRHQSERLCAPLEIDDYQIQSIVETSPPKWHLAHVSWFFEAFVLQPYLPNYRRFDPQFHYCFNSYYQTVGPMQPRARRGLLSRPTVEQIYQYRAHVDEHMQALLATPSLAERPEIAFRVTLGLNHEQQHQELLLMDIKHNLSVNPLFPAYRDDLTGPDAPGSTSADATPGWLERAGATVEIGADLGSAPFCYDNETPRHSELLRAHRLADRLVSNREYLDFIEDGGYDRPELWLADGWSCIQQHAWRCPLYWHRRDREWLEFGLDGLRPLDPAAPVAHVSFYEADAYARWAGKRLPSEVELESMLAEQPLRGNFVEADRLAPQAGVGQWYGDLWEWTSSPYQAYPGFRPLSDALGEYNAKFMCNQMSLRGGSCATPTEHVRAAYRNFYYPHDRWAFTGIRLAEDC